MIYLVLIATVAIVGLKFSNAGKQLRRSWRNQRKERRAIRRAMGFWVTDKFGNTFLARKTDQYVEGTLLREGIWESEVADVLSAFLKPGQNVVVFGTHVGVHAVNMAKIIGDKGHLWGFEANPETQRFFRINLLLNGLENVTVIPKAVYDSRSELSFAMLHGNSGGSQIQLDATQRQELERDDPQVREIKVMAVRADDELRNLPPIDFLMMDIEGAEPRAVLGAENIIDHSPNMIILQEWTPSVMKRHMPLDEYVSFLARKGFVNFFDIRRVDGKTKLIYVEDVLSLINSPGLTNVLIARCKEGVMETFHRCGAPVS